MGWRADRARGEPDEEQIWADEIWAQNSVEQFADEHDSKSGFADTKTTTTTTTMTTMTT